MTNYAVSIGSFHTHKPEIIQHVLACPAVSKLFFPATLPIAPGKEIRLASVDEYDISLVPKEFYKESFINIPLYSENGLKFSGTIHLEEKLVVPNVVSLIFNSEHIAKGIITLADLKTLIAEVIPIFKAKDASVYDQWRPQLTRSDGGVISEPSKYFRDSDDRTYLLDLEWITYYGPEMLKIMGRERFKALYACAEKYELYGGIVVVLQEEPFVRANPAHRERQAQAEAELRLHELISN